MEYKVTVHVKNPEFIRATILDTTFTFFKDSGLWSVADYDEVPVNESTAEYALKVLDALNII